MPWNFCQPADGRVYNNGINLWIDKTLEGAAGESWQTKAFEAICDVNCEKILFFMSTNSFFSVPVCAELKYTLHDKVTSSHYETGKVDIIPVSIDEAGNIGKVIDKCKSDPNCRNKIGEKAYNNIFKNCLNEEEYRLFDVKTTSYGQIITNIYKTVFQGNSEITVVSDINSILKNIPEQMIVNKKEQNITENNDEKTVLKDNNDIVEHNQKNIATNNINISDSSNIKNNIKNILSEVVKEISSEGKDVYVIDQKGEPHFYTKRMDAHLSNINNEKSGWGDDKLYRYEIKTDKLSDGKIGIRFTPNSTGASNDTLNKMIYLHKLQCVSGEGANKNIDNGFLWGRVVSKYEVIDKNINHDDLKGLVKKLVINLLEIEQRIFDEIGEKVQPESKNDKYINIRINNAKSFDKYLNDEYINLHKSDKDILENEINSEKFYKEFSDKFSPEKLKELSGINLLRKIFLNDEGSQDNICSFLEYGKDYMQFGSIKGGTALKHYLYYSKKDETWKTGKPPVDVKNVSTEEAIIIGTKIRDNIVKACEIIEKHKNNLKTENDYVELYREISQNCDDVHKIIFVKKYFHMLYKDLFPCMFSTGYIRKVAEALNFEKDLDETKYIGKFEEKKNQLQISNRVFAEICYKFFDDENFKYQSV